MSGIFKLQYLKAIVIVVKVGANLKMIQFNWFVTYPGMVYREELLSHDNRMC